MNHRKYRAFIGIQFSISNYEKIHPLPDIFSIAILVASGCTRSESTGVSEPVTVVQTTLSPSLPPTLYTTPVPSALVTYRPESVPPEPATVSETPTRIATDNPYLE
jgi:hypothetical protein